MSTAVVVFIFTIPFKISMFKICGKESLFGNVRLCGCFGANGSDNAGLVGVSVLIGMSDPFLVDLGGLGEV